jgi:FKBP-type peptidyl-prolyl cis-trans isomerase FkpA
VLKWHPVSSYKLNFQVYIKKEIQFMKQIIVALALSLVVMSCGKTESGCQPVPVASERMQLAAYCNANNITYTEHPSGMLYQIINPGTGTSSPTASSNVAVVYTGRHFDNTVFDAQANPVTFSLGGLIDGWKVGLPLIKKGGRILLILPSALAYSCTGNGGIKPNEPIFFDITLHDFN